MGLEEKLPSGILLTTVEKVAGYARKVSVWPATFGLACCAMELMATGGPRHDLARFGMERASNTPRQADLMVVAGRVSQKMAPVLRQIYDQMAEPKWVISMGVCASSGGMFNNYAIVQGVDHIVPVDIYLPGCPPRPEMLLDAIVKLHDKIQNMKLGANRVAEIEELEQARLRRLPLAQGTGHLGAGAPAPTLIGRAATERERAAAEPHVQVAGIGLSGTGSGMHGTDAGPPDAAHSELDQPEPGEQS
jgi:NADH-quinone oxidoreductase subunit B